jgi:uncharacterized protein YndB with AHSA1/START domain
MQSHDWSQFLLRIPINRDKQNIFDAWTTRAGLESWFLRKAIFTRPDGVQRDRDSRVEVNDTYEWLWHGWPDEIVEKGAILHINGKDLLEFSFGKAGKVTVTVKEESGHSMLELRQNDIPTDADSQVYFHLGCTKGWLFYLTNLKSILEGGLDLRNRDTELRNVITA